MVSNVKVELKSGTLSYIDKGSGPVVLLIHAFPLNHTMWEPQLGPLSSHFRVIAPDIRGFGASQPPSPWTMDDMAGDLNDLLDHLGIQDASLAGVSIGGYIGLAFWSKYPARVRQLVLSNSRARADNDQEKAARTEMIAAIQQEGASILPDRMLPRLLQPNAAPEVARKVRNMIEQATAPAAAFAVMAMRDRADFTPVLHRIACPCMVVSGTNDVIIPVHDSRAVAERIAGARFVEIPNSGHLSNLENPEAFNAALLSFLST